MISSHGGRYRMHLPSGTWVDIEAAKHALDEAEGRLRAGDRQRAWGAADVVVAIARRPFLAGEEGVWVVEALYLSLLRQASPASP